MTRFCDILPKTTILMEQNMKKTIASVVTALFLVGCADGGSTHNAGKHYEYNFAVDTQGWIGGFADYDRDLASSSTLQFSHSTLPVPLDTSKGAVRISGNNQGNELFMFMKTRIGSLEANATYKVSFNVEFASDIADLNGSTDSRGLMKAGAITFEPKAVLDGVGYYRMNIDKGDQLSGGADMSVIGTLSNGTPNETYALKTVSTSSSVSVRADENGSAWVILGIDTGFEGTTTIYYNHVTVDLEKE